MEGQRWVESSGLQTEAVDEPTEQVQLRIVQEIAVDSRDITACTNHNPGSQTGI